MTRRSNVTFSHGAEILSFFATVLVAAVAVLLLWQSQAVGRGVLQGLKISASSLVPALFPFMVFAGFISGSSLLGVLGRPLAPLAKLLRLPPEMGPVLLLSFIGGYPVGARTIADLLAQGRLSEATASRMLCSCVNAGPSFLLVSVGMALYGYHRVGVVLLVAQVLSSLIIGVILARTAQPAPRMRPQPALPLHTAFVQAVGGGALGMLQVCAFVVFFSGVLALLDSIGVLSAVSQLLAELPLGQGADFYAALCTGLLEVTGGCIAAATLGGRDGFLLTAFFVSFGGLSIICQVMACFRDRPVLFRPFILSRFAGGFLTAAIAYPLYMRYCGDVAASLSGPPLMVVSTHSLMLSLSMMAMCSIVFLSLSIGTGGKKVH